MKTKCVTMEIKSIDEKGTFVAYGSTFGNKDLVGDVVVKGAFTKSLQETPAEKVYMFYNHDSKEIIGEYTKIEEDDHGLLLEGKLFIDNIQRAKETYFLMQKDLINKFSIGYRVVKEKYEKGVNLLQELKLLEVSPVTFPANPEANLLGVKNMNIKECKNIRDFEESLRESGFSKKEAQEFISGVKSILSDSVEIIEEVSQIKQVTSDEWGEIALSLKNNNETLKGITI